MACAAALGEPEAVSEALAAEPELATTADEHGWRPLLYACASPLPAADPARAAGVSRCVELLLDHGADPDTYTLFDESDPNSRIPALYWACIRDQPEVVRLLLERGAEPNDGESIYHAAELDRRACLELLLEHGGNLSGPHARWRNTPLYFLMGYREGQAGTATAMAGARWLLEHGADPNVPSYESQETPLHRAAEEHGRPVAELLLVHGADPNRRRADGRTPYVLALRSGNEAVADLLAEHGADRSRVSTVDALIGACLRADELSARAILSEHPGLLDELTAEERGAVGWAVVRERKASVGLLVTLGFDLESEGPEGGTPLHWAAWFGRTSMVPLLLELGAPIDARDAQFGSSPLGWAAHGSTNCREADDDYCEVVEALLRAGASREAASNQWGEPPEALASPRVAALLRDQVES